MRNMRPRKNQWKGWTLPSKWSVIGGYASIVGIPLAILLFVWPWLSGDANKPEARHLEVMRALANHNKSLKDELWEKYPFGYVLFGSSGGDIVSMPFYKGDLFVEAKWEQTRIEPDYSNKTVKVVIAQPQWKLESGPEVHIAVQKHASAVF